MASISFVDPDADLGVAVAVAADGINANDVASLSFELFERVAQVQALTFAGEERVQDGHGNFDANLLVGAFFPLVDNDAKDVAFPANAHRFVVSFDGNELGIAHCAQLFPHLAKVLDVDIVVHVMQVDLSVFQKFLWSGL